MVVVVSVLYGPSPLDLFRSVAAIELPLAFVFLLLIVEMEPARKAARPSCLQSKLPFISYNALEAMLKLAREEELPTATSARSLRRSRNQDVNVVTPYGKLHQEVDVGRTKVEVQHPMAMLYHMCRVSKGVSELMKPLPNSPASPLRIIIYADEVLPGNPLAVTTERKLWVFYWSVLEFGASVLSHEDIHACVVLYVAALSCVSFVWGFSMLQHVPVRCMLAIICCFVHVVAFMFLALCCTYPFMHTRRLGSRL